MSSTSPDSVTYPPRAYGLLGPAPGNVVNVEDYGAVGDDSFDNTEILQAVIDESAEQEAPCFVFIPPGVFRTGQLVIPTGFRGMIGSGNTISVLKRKASAGNRSLLVAENVDDFVLSDVGFDGNKSEQTVGANTLVLTTCANVKLVRVRCVNAKSQSGGYGSGFLLNDLPSTNPTGRSVVLDNCEAYDNDLEGVAIAQTGAAITVQGGVFSDNGGRGIYFYDQGETPAADTVPNLQIVGARCERNTGSGISLLGFTVSGLGGVRTYGHGSDPVYGLVVQGCQCNYNGAYGIIVQATGASVTGNTTRGNGTTNQAGICCNAENIVVANNIVQDNVYFGIDAGGTWYGTISGNQVTGNGSSANAGTGINLGACQHVVCADNVVIDNGNIAILCSYYDSGVYWFPWGATNVTIARNVIKVADLTYFGVRVRGMPEDINVLDNTFIWPDTVGFNCVRMAAQTGKVHGNRLTGLPLDGLLTNVASNLVFPEWADTLYINTDTVVMANLSSRTTNLAIGEITGVFVDNAGSGYTSDFTVGVTGSGGGSGAVLTAHVTQDGRIAAIEIVSAGTGYAGTLTFDLSAGSGSGGSLSGQIGVPLLQGREMTLVAYLSDFRVESGAILTAPVATTGTVTVASRGSMTVVGTGAVWAVKAFASGNGTVFPTSVVLNNGPRIVTGTGAPSVVLALDRGSFYLRTDGAVGSTIYVSQGGGTWNAIAGV